MMTTSIKSTALAVAIALGGMTFTVPAQAAFVTTDQALQQTSPAAQHRAAFQAALARDDVRDTLGKWGVSQEEASARVEAMSDAEIMAMAENIENDPAGQGVGGALIGAAVTIFVILLITDILGLTNVFNFVN